MADLVCLICDQCGRIHVDDETSETGGCQCGRPKRRMEWATADQVKQYLRDAGARLTSEVSVEGDAAKWRALLSCGRMRVIGSAGIGTPHAHIGMEFWSEHPEPTTEYSSEQFSRFIAGLAAQLRYPAGA